MKVKNIYITLNDVVRSVENTFIKQYESYLEDIKESFEYEVVDSHETGIHKNASFDLTNLPLHHDPQLHEINEKALIIPHEPKSFSGVSVPDQQNIIRSKEKFSFETIEDFNNFVFHDRAFDIFGRADELYKNAINDLNELIVRLINANTELDENDKSKILKTVNVSILSLERDTSKPATLFFLSKYKFLGGNIKFVYDYSQVWEIADLIITANPYIINTRKNRKKVYKINTDYNSSSKATKSFDNIYELIQNKETLKIF